MWFIFGLDSGRRVFKMKRYILTFLILLVVVFSCVYYNTFYYAEQNYKKAEKSQKQAKREVAAGQEVKDYEEAIKKASKVLTFHPKSKWVDDALFLIGKSYYNIGEYAKAERKFNELLTSFPKSNFIEDSYYYLGISRYKQGNRIEAIEALNSLLDNPKMKKKKPEVCFELGRIKFDEGEYAEAIKFYKRMLSQYPREELNSKAQFSIGEAYFILKDYTQAKENFSLVKKYESKGELTYKSIFRTGASAYQLKDYKGGLEIFTQLSREKKYNKFLQQIELKIAEGYQLEDSLDLALKKYEDISLSYPKTEEAAEAYYRAGIIYFEKKIDLTKAQEFFEKAKTEKPNSPFAKSALEKNADISKLTAYKEQVTKEEKDKAVKSLFLLAEFYLFQMNMPESALAEYQIILNEYPDSQYVPKSLYSSAWVYENIYHDTLKAKEFYQRILDNHPNSDYTKGAMLFLGLSSDSLEINIIEKKYLLAESLLIKEEKPDAAKEFFQEIMEKYPSSKYALKSEFALAWILEHYSNPEDSSLVLAYKGLIDKYPGTEYADFAREKLGIAVKKAASTPPKEVQPAPADTSDTTNTATTPTLSGIPKAPVPQKKAQFIYPSSLEESGIKGKVVLKIKIDFTGKVMNTEVLTSIGNIEIDEAAQKAAMDTTFDPMKIDPMESSEGWYIYEVDVNPPPKQESPY